MGSKYIDVSGRTEDQAIEEALRQLNLTRDDVSVEILELPKKTGFLGRGMTPAVVRVTYEVEDEEEPVPAEEPTEPEKPIDTEPAETKSDVPGNAAGEAAGDSDEDDREVEERISAFLTGLMEHMGLDAVPVIEKQEDRIYQVTLEGEDNMGCAIGRKGATLDAIQQLTVRVVNRGRPRQRVRVRMDVGGYRSQREETLQRQAVRVAEKVVLYQRNVAMNPMNAYERHVVHVALQNYPGVTTYSTGNEPNRQVIVAVAKEEE